MLALAAWRDTRCGQCGGDLVETTADENDGSPGHGAYIPLHPVRCYRCTALAESEDGYKDPEKTRHPHALIHQVALRPPRRPIQ